MATTKANVIEPPSNNEMDALLGASEPHYLITVSGTYYAANRESLEALSYYKKIKFPVCEAPEEVPSNILSILKKTIVPAMLKKENTAFSSIRTCVIEDIEPQDGAEEYEFDETQVCIMPYRQLVKLVKQEKLDLLTDNYPEVTLLRQAIYDARHGNSVALEERRKSIEQKNKLMSKVAKLNEGI